MEKEFKICLECKQVGEWINTERGILEKRILRCKNHNCNHLWEINYQFDPDPINENKYGEKSK